MSKKDKVIELPRSQIAKLEHRLQETSVPPHLDSPPWKKKKNPSWVEPVQTAVIKILKIFGVKEQRSLPGED